MPKSRKTNNTGEENRTAWRTPVKLPTNAAAEPMKSLYIQDNFINETASQTVSAAVAALIAPARADEENVNPPQKTLNSPRESEADKPEKQFSIITGKQNANTASMPEINEPESEKAGTQLGEAEFLKLLKTEKMDFYSLAEILRGSSMALYCVLYAESLAKGENRCQIRQSELMMRAGINNPATLYKQERWLTVLGLISKSVRLGNHNGASYEVRSLQTLPLPDFIIAQFDGYLSELVK